jgi:hypothetical protein
LHPERVQACRVPEQEVNRKLLNKMVAGRQMPFFKMNTAAVRANLQAPEDDPQRAATALRRIA